MERIFYLLLTTVLMLTITWIANGEKTAGQVLQGFYKNAGVHVKPDSEGALNISLSMYILQVHAVNEASMDITVDLYLRFFWIDPRLAYSDGPRQVQMGPELANKLVWMPDIFFPNGKMVVTHESIHENKGVRVFMDGNVMMSIKQSVTLHCNMDLWKFPFDEQVCEMHLESYLSSGKDLQLMWKGEGADNGFSMSDMAYKPVAFNINSADHGDCPALTDWDNLYPCVFVKFYLKRISSHYVAFTFLPLFILVILTSFLFWLPFSALNAKVICWGFLFLSMVSLVATSQYGTPQVGYMKAIDVWCGSCLIFMVVGIIEIMVLHQLRSSTEGGEANTFELMKEEDTQANGGSAPPTVTSLLLRGTRLQKVDIALRIAYPLCFIMFVIIFAMVI